MKELLTENEEKILKFLWAPKQKISEFFFFYVYSIHPIDNSVEIPHIFPMIKVRFCFLIA